MARDLCQHRGTRLSGGWISNDRLVCPMHGLQYDGSGRCVMIPSIAESDARIPDRLRLRTFLSQERYGLLWVCLAAEPICNMPEWPHLEDPLFKPIYIPPGTWRAAASRHVENFNDVAHFPWVHASTFGGDIDAAFPPYSVEATQDGLHFELPYVELGNRFPDGRDDLKNREVTYKYDLTFPFSTCLLVDVKDSTFKHYIVDTVCPVSVRESRVFQIMTDNSGNPDKEYWTRDALNINNEDQPLVEAQYPEELPLDLREEVHIPADRMSLEYRKTLVSRFGLGAPITS